MRSSPALQLQSILTKGRYSLQGQRETYREVCYTLLAHSRPPSLLLHLVVSTPSFVPSFLPSCFLCGFSIPGFSISEFCSNASTGHSRGDFSGISFSSFAQFLFVLTCQNSVAFVSCSLVRSFMHVFLMNKVMLLSLR